MKNRFYYFTVFIMHLYFFLPQGASANPTGVVEENTNRADIDFSEESLRAIQDKIDQIKELEVDPNLYQTSNADEVMAQNVLDFGIYSSYLQFLNALDEIHILLKTNLSKLSTTKRALDQQAANADEAEKLYLEELRRVIPGLNETINSKFSSAFNLMLNLNGGFDFKFSQKEIRNKHWSDIKRGVLASCQSKLCVSNVTRKYMLWVKYVYSLNQKIDILSEIEGTEKKWMMTPTDTIPFYGLSMFRAAKEYVKISLEKNKSFTVAGLIGQTLLNASKTVGGVGLGAISVPAMVIEKGVLGIKSLLSYQYMDLELAINPLKVEDFDRMEKRKEKWIDASQDYQQLPAVSLILADEIEVCEGEPQCDSDGKIIFDGKYLESTIRSLYGIGVKDPSAFWLAPEVIVYLFERDILLLSYDDVKNDNFSKYLKLLNKNKISTLTTDLKDHNISSMLPVVLANGRSSFSYSSYGYELGYLIEELNEGWAAVLVSRSSAEKVILVHSSQLAFHSESAGNFKNGQYVKLIRDPYNSSYPILETFGGRYVRISDRSFAVVFSIDDVKFDKKASLTSYNGYHLQDVVLVQNTRDGVIGSYVGAIDYIYDDGRASLRKVLWYSSGSTSDYDINLNDKQSGTYRINKCASTSSVYGRSYYSTEAGGILGTAICQSKDMSKVFLRSAYDSKQGWVSTKSLAESR